MARLAACCAALQYASERPSGDQKRWGTLVKVRNNSHLRRRAVQEHHLRHAERRGRPEERVPEALGRQGLHGAEDSEPA